MFQRNFTDAREPELAKGLAPLVSEIRMVDVQEIVSLITMQKISNFADVVNSAAEAIFAPGFIHFGQGGSVVMGWESPPEITFDVVANLAWGKVYVSLRMQPKQVEIRLNYLSPYTPSWACLMSADNIRRSFDTNTLLRRTPSPR